MQTGFLHASPVRRRAAQAHEHPELYKLTRPRARSGVPQECTGLGVTSSPQECTASALRGSALSGDTFIFQH